MPKRLKLSKHDELEIIRIYKERGSEAAAKENNVSINTVHRVRKKHKEPVRPKSPKQDLTGWVRGSLTVLKYLGSGKWLCQCSCNKGTVTRTTHQLTKSGVWPHCGAALHHKSKHRLYFTYMAMHARCYNPRNKDYKHYRTIGVCSRWHIDNSDGFWNFVHDMDGSYVEGLTLGRIENHVQYSPENCRWENDEQQQGNTSKNVHVNWNDKTYIASELAKEIGISPSLMAARIRNGWDIKRAVTTPVNKEITGRPGVDLTGRKLGAYRVIEYAYSDVLRQKFWRCRCETCGKTRVWRGASLNKFKENSCRCERHPGHKALVEDPKTGKRTLI